MSLKEAKKKRAQDEAAALELNQLIARRTFILFTVLLLVKR
jgi:hypothetical protein